MSECGATNPVDGLSCVLQSVGHGWHVDADGKGWMNMARVEQAREFAAAKDKKGRQSTHRRILNEARAGKRKVLAGDVGPGLDPEIAGVWLQDEWVTYAGQIVDRFLRQRATEFTTAEDIWPLLDKPEEMRAMSVLVQALLRAGHIEEVAAKRLRGIYRTKDGYEFAENKLVPIYRSRICSG